MQFYESIHSSVLPVVGCGSWNNIEIRALGKGHAHIRCGAQPIELVYNYLYSAPLLQLSASDRGKASASK